jgi:(R,R)-butanediol dehydrogenase/meso-butanediol dehydrogenase/diacetyl reductase
MKAAVWRGYKDVRIEEKEMPHAAYARVLIKVAFTGICVTDRYEYTDPNFIQVESPHRLTEKCTHNIGA